MRRVIGCVIAFLAAEASAPASTWIRVSSPSVEILTDGSQSTARAVLNRFETLRRIFRESYLGESAAPVRVFLFASEDEFQKYRAAPNLAGFYQHDEDRDFIVLYQVTALKRTASHEYLHMVMTHASTKLPAWLEEGVPEFYSTLAVNAAKMRVGEVIEPHRNLLATQLWLSAEDLALGSPTDGRIFYAESWALVHMLSLKKPWAGGMPEFVKLVSQGRDPDEAFSQAFGKSMEDAVAALRLYVRNMKDVTAAAPPADEFKISPPTKMTAVEVTLALADLALRTEHRSLAFDLLSRAGKENPQSPAAVAGLGELALSQGRKTDAEREFARALSMGYRDAGTYFQLAMLRNDNALLEQAVAVDPNFAEAHFLLGVRATDSGNLAAAIEHLRHAVAAKPRRFSYWHALGYAQAKSGDRHGASESARRAVQIASTTMEEEMAAALAQLASEAPAANVKKPAVVTPPSWQNRKGDTKVEGTLKRVDCDATPVRLLVATSGGKTVELTVRNPTAVEMVNAEGVTATLVCGEQTLPIAIEYFAAGMDVTRIEFRPTAIMKR
jgi:tetratricopeptide (TPR) repeat protein